MCKMLNRIRKQLGAGLFSFRRSHRRSHEEGRANLLGLPQELLDSIIDFLDISEAACLSVCNKQLYWRLGKGRRELLHLTHGRGSQRKEFLMHLARDNPLFFFCHSCVNLHLLARVGPAGPVCFRHAKKRPACIEEPPLRDYPAVYFRDYLADDDYHLVFAHEQLVMARHHSGSNFGLPMSSLSFTGIRRNDWHKVWTLLNVEPRIIDDKLLLRVQHWLMFDLDDMPKIDDFGPSLCSHATRYAERTYADLIECHLQHVGHRASCSKCSILYRQEWCGVEFESDAFRLDHGKVAVLITKWLNLGKGDSPSDPTWQRNACAIPLNCLGGPLLAEVKDNLRIRSTFEEHMGKSQHTATCENASLLREEFFRKKLYRCRALNLWMDQRC